MVVDLKLVKDIINEQVVDLMDHRHLNHEVPPFDHVFPTVENRRAGDLAASAARICDSRMHGLRNIRLYETSRSLCRLRRRIPVRITRVYRFCCLAPAPCELAVR